jgi:hypothetical protein
MEEQRERTQVWATRAKPKVGHKGANEQIMFQRPHQLQEAYQKRKGKGKLRIVNLEEPSSIMITHLKIEMACIFYKATNTFYLQKVCRKAYARC